MQLYKLTSSYGLYIRSIYVNISTDKIIAILVKLQYAAQPWPCSWRPPAHEAALGPISRTAAFKALDLPTIASKHQCSSSAFESPNKCACDRQSYELLHNKDPYLHNPRFQVLTLHALSYNTNVGGQGQRSSIYHITMAAKSCDAIRACATFNVPWLRPVQTTSWLIHGSTDHVRDGLETGDLAKTTPTAAERKRRFYWAHKLM